MQLEVQLKVAWIGQEQLIVAVVDVWCVTWLQIFLISFFRKNALVPGNYMLVRSAIGE